METGSVSVYIMQSGPYLFDIDIVILCCLGYIYIYWCFILHFVNIIYFYLEYKFIPITHFLYLYNFMLKYIY